MPTFSILGPPVLSASGEATHLPRKQVALLAVLAYRFPHPVRREWLASMLWPNASRKASNHSLSQALYNLRRHLGDDAVSSHPTGVLLGTVECDLQHYRQSLRVGAFDEAARLIRGDFCEALAIEDSVEFQHFLDRARGEIRGSLEAASAGREAGGVTIAAGPDESASGSTGRIPFVGRLSERAALEAAWQRAATGEVSTALVVGELGIGKSALCERVVKRAALRGWRCLPACGFQAQRNLPYGILSQLLHHAQAAPGLKDVESHWRAVLAELCPALGAGESDEQSGRHASGAHRFAAAFGHAIALIARSEPVTIWVDDIQWADSASLAVLHYFVHAPPRVPVFVLFASRPDLESTGAQQSWSPETTLRLRGLSVEETAYLSRSVGRGEEAEAIHGLTAGNPLLIKAMLNGSGRDSDLPPSVRDCFAAEIRRLQGQALSLGAALAVAGEPVSVEDLAWLVDLEVEEIDAGLERLLETEFATLLGDGRLALRHDAVADAFLHALPPARSARLHGRAASLLRDQGRPDALVATQLAVAGGDEETFTYALRAAEASVRLFAFREAEHFYRVAIACARSPRDEIDTRIALSEIYRSRGQFGQSHSILEGFNELAAVDGADHARFEAHLLLARLSEIGPPSLTRAALRRAQQLEGDLPTALAARLYSEIATNAQQGLYDLGLQATRHALRLVAELSEGPERFRLEVVLASLEAVTSQTPPDLARFDRLTRRSERWPDVNVTCLAAAGAVRVSQGQPDEAARRLMLALEHSERLGLVGHRLRVLNNLGVCYLEQGSWDDALAQFEVVVRAAGEYAPKEVPSAMANIAIIELERGRLQAAIAVSKDNLGMVPGHARMRLGSMAVCGLAQLEVGALAQARQIESEIRVQAEANTAWSNDVSYLEIFMARMGVIDGAHEEVVGRLEDKVEEFRPRDFYCAARMEVEALRIRASVRPEEAIGRARALRPKLAEARARPLVERLDGIIARCLNRAAESHAPGGPRRRRSTPSRGAPSRRTGDAP